MTDREVLQSALNVINSLVKVVSMPPSQAAAELVVIAAHTFVASAEHYIERSSAAIGEAMRKEEE